MTKTKSVTLGKFEENAINEDAVIARKNIIAVSDGAGGGGLFADRWSKYLLRMLPDSPIQSSVELDEWIGSIWEEFYNRAEESAKELGGMALDKFYDEGSFATLAAVWKQEDGTCRWMAYGDSVVFHYDFATKKLSHSFTSLADFDNPPFLINCKDELNPLGFGSGEFTLGKNSFVFVTSDALAHYIIMMYELSHKEIYMEEISRAQNELSKHSNVIKKVMAIGEFSFETMVIRKLRKVVYNEVMLRKWLKSLYNKDVLVMDDYSVAVMYE
ncbi:hypothetical protein [uncultured Duncaniella sp.]|uniref:hypothetical protein n=1 Tax=uncultured Duncaniella sp. TaxID=2768039 RepID=UPI0025F5E5A0|nr:hypothetical protein [uncultured Duncaniella sp.]